jgi:hypothetical protein
VSSHAVEYELHVCAATLLTNRSDESVIDVLSLQAGS